jgi:UDP-N-acetyl-2-amino-2-deoxyglucuronate dehydrogenase
LVGMGAVAEAHLRAYRQMPDIRLVGFVEPRAPRRVAVSEKYAVPGFTTLAELLKKETPQIACVLTPVATHRGITETLASHGVHVLCEKPLAIELDDVHAMQAACTKAGVKFQYGSSYRYLPAVQRARELILSGKIGVVRLMIETLISGRGAAAYTPMSADHYPAGGIGGGGAGLVDHGVHLLDIFPWLVDSEITQVIGQGDISGSAALPEYTIMRLKNGTLGFLVYDDSTYPALLPWEGLFSQSAAADTNNTPWLGADGTWDPEAGNFAIHGTRGSLRVFHYANRLISNIDGQIRDERLPPGGAPQHFAVQLRAFCDAITQDKDVAVPLSVGHITLKILHTIYASRNSNRWETV